MVARLRIVSQDVTGAPSPSLSACSRNTTSMRPGGSLVFAHIAKKVEPVAPIAPLCSAIVDRGQRACIHSTTCVDHPRFCGRLIEPPSTATETGSPASKRATTRDHALRDPSLERVRCSRLVGSSSTALSEPQARHSFPPCWHGPVTAAVKVFKGFGPATPGASGPRLCGFSRSVHADGCGEDACQRRHRAFARDVDGHIAWAESRALVRTICRCGK